MSNPVFRLTVLGARGSMAVSGDGYHLFGGMTSCYHVQAGEENLFLDAGTGLLRAPVRFPHPPVILLTHLHLDHILGLGMYSRMSMRGEETRILVPVCAGEDPRVHLDRLYSPPLWPLSLADYNGDVRIESLSLPLSVGDVLVEGIRGCHPGNSTILKLSRAGKSLVYATDYEYESATFSSLIDFSRGADLILYDGQYTAQEAEQRKGFGHSTADLGLTLMEQSGAKQLILIHHDPLNQDDTLLARDALLPAGRAHYARKDEVIEL